MISNIGNQSNRTTSLDIPGSKASAGASGDRVANETEAKILAEGDSVTISNQAREQARAYSGSARARAEAKAENGDMVQKFAAEMKEAMPSAVEVIFGVMQKNLESALESAERQRQQVKEESERLAELAETEQADSAPDNPEAVGAYEARGTDQTRERKSGDPVSAGYGSAGLVKTAQASSTNFSRKV